MTDEPSTATSADERAAAHASPCAVRTSERGMTLMVLLWMLVLMLGAGAALHNAVLGDTKLRGIHARSTSAFYAAEAALNRGMGDFRNVFLNYNVPTDFSLHT